MPSRGWRSLSENTNPSWGHNYVLWQNYASSPRTSFKDRFYEQVEGAAMGSPLSPIVANIYMEHFEKMALDSSQFQPNLWLWYVDDTFVVWPHREETLNSFLTHLNSIRDSIQFTMERRRTTRPLSWMHWSRGRRINYLPQFTGRRHTDRYLNFRSHHHPRILTGVIRCLTNRAHNICDPTKQQDDIQHLCETFQANSFPVRVTDLILEQKHHDNPQQQQPPIAEDLDEESNKERILYLPYVKGLSEKIEKMCRSTKSHRVKVVFKPVRTIRKTLMKVRTECWTTRRQWLSMRSLAVTANRYTWVRPREHSRHALVSTSKGFDHNNGVAVHVHKYDHHIDWNRAKTVATEQYYWKRRVHSGFSLTPVPWTQTVD